MSYEVLVGLDVKDNQIYQAYRDGMMPILKQHGGRFTYDFKIDEVLKSETSNSINRVFTICFPDKNKMKAFFSNQDYLSIKQEFFTASVDSTTIIAEYEKNG